MVAIESWAEFPDESASSRELSLWLCSWHRWHRQVLAGQASSGRIVDCVCRPPWQRVDVGLHGGSQIPGKSAHVAVGLLCLWSMSAVSHCVTFSSHLSPSPSITAAADGRGEGERSRLGQSWVNMKQTDLAIGTRYAWVSKHMSLFACVSVWIAEA